MDSFWPIIWAVVIVVSVVFVVVLRDILTDLSRATDLNGWQKAVWLLLLVFMPCLAASAFIVARAVGSLTGRWSRPSRHFRGEFTDLDQGRGDVGSDCMAAGTAASTPARTGPDHGNPRFIAAVRAAHLTEPATSTMRLLDVVIGFLVVSDFRGRPGTTTGRATGPPG